MIYYTHHYHLLILIQEKMETAVLGDFESRCYLSWAVIKLMFLQLIFQH